MDIVIAGFIIAILSAIRYIGFTSIAYFLLYKKFASPMAIHKIEPQLPSKDQIRREIRYGLFNQINFLFFGMVMFLQYKMGFTKIYWNISDYGIFYFFITAPLLFLIQDAYFFWIHKWLHIPWLFKRFHVQHHLSRNPTPFAAFSVHPVEGFLEVLFRPLVIAVLPLHPAVMIFYFVVSMVLNVMGHSGYETFPKILAKNPITKFFSSSSHHFMHHRFVDYNFSLYFTFWDKWMKTEHPDSDKVFESKAI